MAVCALFYCPGRKLGDEMPLIDEAFPSGPTPIPQCEYGAVGDARQRAPFAVPKAINYAVIVGTRSRSEPLVPVFILQLDVVAVSVARNTGLRSFLFQVEESTRLL